MARERFAATGVAEETETTPETTPDATPAEAPSPAEVPTEETPVAEPAAARTTLASIMSLVFESPEALKVLDQMHGIVKLCNSFRSNIHAMISAETKIRNLTQGQDMFFTSMAHGTWDIQTWMGLGEGVMMGVVTLDNQGEAVASSDPNIQIHTIEVED